MNRGTLVAVIVCVCAAVGPSSASAQEEQAITGIYVERYVPPEGNPCGTNPPSPGDGWFAVSGFPNRGATCPGVTPQSGLAYGSNVSFNGSNGAIYRVFAVDDSQPIGTITVSGSGFTLLVGRSTSTFPPFTDPSNPLQVSGGGTIGAINAAGGTVQVRSTDSVTSVSAGTVVRIDSRNSIGAVSATSTIGMVRAPRLTGLISGSSITAVRVENWNSGASQQDFSAGATATTGNIGLVFVTNARLIGTVRADLGSITTVQTTGASSGIGPATGSAMALRAKSGIATIDSPSINANIDARFNAGTGQIQTLRTSTGNFSGSLSSAAIGSTGTGVSIAGNLLANVTVGGDVLKSFTVTGSTSADVSLLGTITQPVSFNGGYSSGTFTLGNVASNVTFAGNLGSSGVISSTATGSTISVGADIPSGRSVQIAGNHSGSLSIGSSLAGALTVGGTMAGSVVIGGSLASTGSITTGSAGVPGLAGQIIINNSDGSGDWLGTVRTGGATGAVLSPVPEYQEASAFLGGGAVGLVRFHLHANDCWPFSGETVAREAAPSATNSIKMRHYGPVWFDPAGPKPFKVMRSAPALAGGWSDETDCFTMSLDSANKTIVNLFPNLSNDAPIQAGFYYTVSRAVDGEGENILKCDLAPELRPEVADYDPLEFNIEDCMGDADNDGNVDFDDVLTVLAWFGDETSCLKYGDADRDGNVDFNDTLTVLANFNHDCTMMEFAGGGGGGLEDAATALTGALEAMGFESLGDFFTAFESADKATRDEMIRALGEQLGGKR